MLTNFGAALGETVNCCHDGDTTNIS